MPSRLLAVLVIAACGDGATEAGSGVEGDKPLVALSDAEIDLLCRYTVGLGPITAACAMGERVTIGKLTIEECVAQNVQRRAVFGSCTATVAEVEDCTEQLLPYTQPQLCANVIDLPERCDLVFTSACGGL